MDLLNKNEEMKTGEGIDQYHYYSIGGVTLQVKFDQPITPQTFHPKFQKFQINDPKEGEDIILLHHHFSLPDISGKILGQKIYHCPPWKIYKQQDAWLYLGIAPEPEDHHLHRVVYFNSNHTQADIYNPGDEIFRQGNIDSLTLFPTDQILLARLLADRQGCILHSAGMIMDGQGFLFAGHSGAGKSTIVTLLREHGEILCDDRMILRRWPEGFRIHGTWSHGDVPDVSSDSAPLRAILLLEQAPTNQLIPMENRRELLRRLPFLIVKPLVTADWWEKTLDLLEMILREVPIYRLQFDKSGQVADVVRSLV